MPPTQAELQIILEVQDRATQQLQQVGQLVVRLQQQVETAGRRGGPGGLLGGVLGGVNLAAGMTAVQTVLGGVQRAWDLVADSIVGVNSRQEEAAAAFQAFTGSAQRAAQIMEFLRREAQRTT